MDKKFEFDKEKADKILSTEKLSAIYKGINSSKGEIKEKLFKEYIRKLISLFDDNKITYREMAYLIIAFVDDDELTNDDKPSQDLIYEAGVLETLPGSVKNVEPTDEASYLKVWTEWRKALEEYISSKFELKMDLSLLQRIADSFSIGKISSFKSKILSLYNGQMLIPYYIANTNKGQYFIFEEWWMELDSKEFSSKLIENFQNLKQVYIRKSFPHDSKLVSSKVHRKDRHYSVFKLTD